MELRFTRSVNWSKTRLRNKSAPCWRSKIKPLSAFLKIRNRLRRLGKKLVFTNGCFDIVHLGHVDYLERAKRLGDVLVVAVNRDSSVRRLKGPRRPVNGERDRSGVLAGLGAVDYVILFEEDTPYRVIEKIQPDVLVKGGDWRTRDIVGAGLVRAKGGRVLSIPFLKGRSTTALLRTICRGSE